MKGGGLKLSSIDVLGVYFEAKKVLRAKRLYPVSLMLEECTKPQGIVTGSYCRID